MFHRRLAPVLAVLVLCASALAQLTKEAKNEVLENIDHIMSDAAFVPGVDLSSWRTYLPGESTLEAVEHPYEFANIVNGALRKFGVSHIRLMPGRQRSRMRRFDPEAFQDPGTIRSSRSSRPTATMRWMNDDTAVIRVPNFTSGYRPSEVEECFEDAAKAKYLVLDLRHNPGGEVNNMMHLLGMVIPGDKPVGTFVTRRMARSYEREKGVGTADPVKIAAWANRAFKPRPLDIEPFEGEIAVLVDNRSGSASEIVANALREIRRSPIVGTQTAGAVLMSTYASLPYGFSIQFPISDFVSAAGRRLEGKPLKPDAELTTTETGSEVALARAESLLKALPRRND